ncbi:dipeptide-binding protein DppE precursor [Clostridium tepidiprofundi DSM 19306]|uniref:Dipeptide-binding protein DppE n=1 Tax=Clostridium tepidiprofundi DSM 19306 TaxID=1121338 RepID=A0A151B6N8_9CLOT|nr:peptide ABC transporter substrate-binding protein [Clostridium tepidiprofundi]KYH35559.1 dipeptide-binding protein DppE precursor [Clostridium tepidiprofundi DSM 19306]
MKGKKIMALLLTVSLGVSAALMGCGKTQTSTSDNEKKTETTQKEQAKGGIDKDQYLNIILGNEPKSLDPSKSSDLYSSQVLAEVMEGLTRIEQENGKDVIKPAGAKSWEKNEDGTVWTFHLRDYKWSDGKTVTANDYVYGIKRTLNPKTGSPYAFLLYPIKNAKAYNAGKAKADEVGVEAVDDKTLKFTLESPCAYFMDLTYFKVMHPQRKDIIEAAGERYGTEKDTMVFCGPFVISEWVHQSKVVLEKNKNYWDADSVKLNKVTMKIISQEASRMSELYNGGIDATGVSDPNWVKKLSDTGKFNVLKGYDPSTTYVFFNQKDKYFKNAKIRKAFILADDREARAEVLFRNLAQPAYGWCPPSLQIGGEDFRAKVNYEPLRKLVKENPDPKKLLIEGLKEIGADPDPAKMDVTLLEGSTSARSKEFAEFAQENYRQKLGVNAKVEYVKWPIFVKRTDEMDYQVASMAWNGDYNDPMTFFDMWTTNAKVVPTGWSNPKYDKLIEKAAATLDKEVRTEAFKEAENILLYEDGVISPGVYRKRQTFVRKYAKNIMYPLFGAIEVKYAYTEGRK